MCRCGLVLLVVGDERDEVSTCSEQWQTLTPQMTQNKFPLFPASRQSSIAAQYRDESGGMHRPTSRSTGSVGGKKSPKTGGGSEHVPPYQPGSTPRARAHGKRSFCFPMAPPHKTEAKIESAVCELVV